MLKILFVVLLNLNVSLAFAKTHSLLIFGDSLSDTGNCYEFSKAYGPAVPPANHYYQGHFCNGPSWSDYLAEDLQIDILNYAVGGALTGNRNILERFGYQIGGLSNQIDRFEATHSSIDSLVILQIGANDMLSLLLDPSQLNEEKIQEQIKNSMQNLETAIKRLQTLGAKKLIIWNLPDLGQTAKLNNGPPLNALAPLMSKITDLFNAALFNLVQKQSRINLKQQIIHYDAHAAIREVGKQFLAENVNPFAHTLHSTFSNPPKIEIVGPKDKNLFFYDELHLSTLAWKRFSSQFQKFVQPLTLENQK